MSRKQGLIRLGRSKSPTQFKPEPTVHRMPDFSMRTSREKEPLQQTHLNQSMHVAPQLYNHKLENTIHAHTHSGFYPPSPRNLDQVIIKDNSKGTTRAALIQGSPIKRVVVTRPLAIPTEVSPNKNESSILVTRTNQHEAQLQRKIKVLEARVQQLHQEKQACVVKTHEESKKLWLDNAALQNRLANLENEKNQQINHLRQETVNLRNMLNSQRIAKVETSCKPVISPEIHKSVKNAGDHSPIANKSLKNMAYIDDDEEDKVSLSNHTYKNDTNKVSDGGMDNSQVLKRHSQMEAQFRQLLAENQALREEIKDLKQTMVHSSEVIEENNNKIVQNYDQRINKLLEDLRLCKEQNKCIRDSLSFSKQQVEEYVQRNMEKSQQMMRIQDKYKQQNHQLKESVLFCRQQLEEYVQRILEKSQELMRVEDSYKVKLCLAQKKLEEAEQRCCLHLSKIQELSVMVSNSKAVESSSSNWTQTEDERCVADSCQKCKELIKTLVKLNQKTFSKTS